MFCFFSKALKIRLKRNFMHAWYIFKLFGFYYIRMHMPKNTFILLFILLVPFILTGQTKVGVMGGLNYSKVVREVGTYTQSIGVGQDDIADISWKLRWKAGIVLDISVTEYFGIGTGLVFSARGMEENYENTFSDGTNVTRLNYVGHVYQDYLEIPLNFIYNMPMSGNKLQLYGGFYMAFGLGGYATTETWTETTNLQTGQRTTEVEALRYSVSFSSISPYSYDPNLVYRNSTDFGVNIGANYIIMERFGLGLQYSRGLSNWVPKVSDPPPGYSRSDEDDISFRMIALTATIFLN